jgi:hypothetical protein
MELSSHLTEDGGAKTGGGYGNETPQRDRDDASVGAGGENGTEGAAGEADAKGGEPTAVPGTASDCVALHGFWRLKRRLARVHLLCPPCGLSCCVR